MDMVGYIWLWIEGIEDGFDISARLHSIYIMYVCNVFQSDKDLFGPKTAHLSKECLAFQTLPPRDVVVSKALRLSASPRSRQTLAK